MKCPIFDCNQMLRWWVRDIIYHLSKVCFHTKNAFIIETSTASAETETVHSRESRPAKLLLLAVDGAIGFRRAPGT